MEDHTLKVLNLKVQQERQKMIKDYSFDVKEVKASKEEFGLGRAIAIKVKNQDFGQFK